ncbi:MAG: virulence protein RhuM/Fic/DOC family protein [Candidatus Omnitrophica bacterium]|nr:virulence protein RhuM/Fic/DOC family protein [Candidatus Omnitrophota bacterium]
MKKSNSTEIQNTIIFRPQGSKVSVEVKLKDESVWLNLNQIALLFGRDKSVISRHLRNIFISKELYKNSTVAFFATVQKEGGRLIERRIECFNLDVIISLGYRVNSKRGIQFRIWATNILKQHLIHGYTINEKRLKEQANNIKALQRTVQLLAEISQRKALTSDEATGLIEVIRDYSYGLDVLDDYDHGRIEIKSATAKKSYQLNYDEGIRLIQQMRQKFGGSDLFGQEKDASFKSALGAIYQTFGTKDLYPSIEEKAANLLYLVVKNHAFSDGNKRIAATLFVWFLDRNKILYKADGSKRIADNALVAITLMIAESQPKEKDVITALVVNLINKLN